MPNEKTGSSLLKIVDLSRESKKKVRCTFDNGERLIISAENFMNNHLYVDMFIDPDQYKEIVRYESLSYLRDYAIKLVAHRVYSRKQMLEKMMNNKGATFKEANQITEELIARGGIDDQNFAECYLQNLKDRGYSKDSSIILLHIAGIHDNIIETLDFGNEEEELFEIVSSLFTSKYRTLAPAVAKKKILDYLNKKGFHHSDIQKATTRYLENVSEKELNQLALEADLNVAYNKYKSRYQGNELKSHMIKRLQGLGYGYYDIIEVMGDIVYES